jgi:hypothetical protein
MMHRIEFSSRMHDASLYEVEEGDGVFRNDDAYYSSTVHDASLHEVEEGDGVFRNGAAYENSMHDVNLQEVEEGDGVFRDDAAHYSSNVVLKRHQSTKISNRLRCSNLSPRTRILIALTGCLAFALVFTTKNVVQTPEPEVEAVKERDPFFFEPETKIIAGRAKQNPATFRPAACPNLDFPLANRTDSLQWVVQGQELVRFIKEKYMANLEGGDWSNHFGYGSNIVLSGDGQRMAVSYEGAAGFDRAFGMHIDIFEFNGTHWNLEQTITDVKRGHGHEKDVRYQSMAMSTNGQRIAFSDGHGVSIFQFDPERENRKWQPLTPIMDPLNVREHAQGKQHQFGLNIAINCDGSVLAISGTSYRNSYTKIYQEQLNSTTSVPVQWAEIGEIQGVKFGGSIKLNAAGTRLAMGTVASEGWRGMVQVFDRGVNKNRDVWTRVGQPIVGKTALEMWGGKVALSADGSTLVVSSNRGDTNRVVAYQLSTDTPAMWKPHGPELHGTGNQYEHFGSDVALSSDGTILAVGAPGDFELFTAQKAGKPVSPADAPFVSGRIYMYRLFAEETDDPLQWIRIDNGELVSAAPGDRYGKSISMSAGGTFVAGGAPRRTGKAYQHILGSAHVYQAI